MSHLILVDVLSFWWGTIEAPISKGERRDIIYRYITSQFNVLQL